MKNKQVVIAFVCGFGLGAGLTYLEMRNRIDAEFEEIVEEEEVHNDKYRAQAIEEAKNEGLYTPDMDEMDADEIIERINNAIDAEFEGDDHDVEQLTKHYKSDEATIVNYSEISKVGKDARKIDSDMPYAIGKMEFENDCELYEKVKLFLYGEDGVITDDHDNMIERQEYSIDSKGFIQPDDLYGDDIPNVMFIRNDVREVDYQIYWMPHESFEEAMVSPDRS